MSKSILVPDAGIDIVISGPGKPDKQLHVTQARRAQDWVRYAITEDGHQTEEIAGVAKHAKKLGYTDVRAKDEPAPAEPAAPEPFDLDEVDLDGDG